MTFSERVTYETVYPKVYEKLEAFLRKNKYTFTHYSYLSLGMTMYHFDLISITEKDVKIISEKIEEIHDKLGIGIIIKEQ